MTLLESDTFTLCVKYQHLNFEWRFNRIKPGLATFYLLFCTAMQGFSRKLVCNSGLLLVTNIKKI